MSPIDMEKNTTPNEAEIGSAVDTNAAPCGKDEISSLDGDDAFKLAGAHASKFDDQYYARLRWRIVSPLS
jgi:hypothetical protein